MERATSPCLTRTRDSLALAVVGALLHSRAAQVPVVARPPPAGPTRRRQPGPPAPYCASDTAAPGLPRRPALRVSRACFSVSLVARPAARGLSAGPVRRHRDGRPAGREGRPGGRGPPPAPEAHWQASRRASAAGAAAKSGARPPAAFRRRRHGNSSLERSIDARLGASWTRPEVRVCVRVVSLE